MLSTSCSVVISNIDLLTVMVDIVCMFNSLFITVWFERYKTRELRIFRHYLSQHISEKIYNINPLITSDFITKFMDRFIAHADNYAFDSDLI